MPITQSKLTPEMLTSESRLASNGERNYKDCPLCHSEKWKLYVNEDTGRWFCHAGSHGSGGKMDVEESEATAGQRLLALLRGDTGGQSHHEWRRIDWPATTDLCLQANRYLTIRNISAPVRHMLQLLETASGMRVLIPFFSEGGALIHWTARAYSIQESPPKYLNAPGPKPLYVPGINQTHINSPAEADRRGNPVVVVEGPFDAIRVWQAGYRAVALGGKTCTARNRTHLADLTRGRKTVILLDREATFEAGVLAREIDGARVAIPTAADPADMRLGEIRGVINEA